MDEHTAIELLRPAMEASDRIWADLGAGSGIFTRALARLLGPLGTVYAVDNDRDAVRKLQAAAVAHEPSRQIAGITAVLGDISHTLPLPPLDGLLLANVLHFVPDEEQATTLARLATLLRAEGRVVIADYDGRPANRWVPHPVPRARLRELVREAKLGDPVVVATRPSAYGGILYVAVLRPL